MRWLKKHISTLLISSNKVSCVEWSDSIKYTDYENLTSFLKENKNTNQLTIVLISDEVILRENVDTDSPLEFVKSILPGTDLNKIHYQHIPQLKQVGICRVKVLDALLKEFDGQAWKIGKILFFEKAAKIGLEKLRFEHEEYLRISEMEILSSTDELLEDHRIEYNYYRKYRNWGALLLMFFALTAFFSFFSFQRLNQKNQEVLTSLADLNRQHVDIGQRYEELSSEQEFLELFNYHYDFSIAVYLDDLARSNSKEIQWISVSAFPNKQNKSKWKQPPLTITISGSATGIDAFRANLENWKKLNWVEHIEISSFQENSEGKKEFELIIKTNPSHV